MKKSLAIILTLGACSTAAPDYNAMTKGEVVNYAEEQRKRADGNRVGGVLFGGGGVAVCAQTGACVFPM